MIKLGEAMLAMSDREAALDIPVGDSPYDLGPVDGPRARLFLSGFDIDFNELEAALRAFDDRGLPSGVWLQGLVTGLIAAERETED